MKKFILALAACAASVTAQADYGSLIWGNFDVGGDWLYWKPYQDGLEYAQVVNLSEADGVTTIVSNSLSPEFPMSNGFRVFVNYTSPITPWAVSAAYSQIRAGSANDFIATPGQFAVLNSVNFPLFQSVNSNFETVSFSNVTDRWSSRLQFFDLDLCRVFQPFPLLDVSPHFGFRALWLRQDLGVDGTGIAIIGFPVPVSITSSFEQKFEGYGLQGGLNAALQVGGGFSIGAALNGSLLYARLENNQLLSLTTDLGFVTTTTTEGSGTTHHLTPVFDGFIGLMFDGVVGAIAFNLHAGWEQHLIMSSSHFNVANYLDFSIQGLTLGGSVSF